MLGYVLATGYLSAFGLLDVPQMEANVAQLEVVSEELDDPALRCWAALWRSVTAILIGDLPAAHRHADATAKLAEEIRLPFLRWVAAYVRANLGTIAGHPDTAEALAERGLELSQAAGMPDAFRISGAQLLWIRYDQGRLEELLDLLSRAAGARRRPP